MIDQSEWEWFGDVGHCIIGRWCRFHLTTRVGCMLVSTIGAYVHPRHCEGSEQAEAEWLKKNWPGEDIGAGRKYETMVFRVGDQVCQCGCNMPIPTEWMELDAAGYNTPADATQGHMAMCKKWADPATVMRELL